MTLQYGAIYIAERKVSKYGIERGDTFLNDTKLPWKDRSSGEIFYLVYRINKGWQAALPKKVLVKMTRVV